MRTLHHCLTLLALAAYFLVGGGVGLCTVWGGLGIEHHHHAAADNPATHFHSHATPCDSHGHDDQQPCRDSAAHDSDEFLAVTLDAPAPIASPLIGDAPLPAPDFSAAPAPRSLTIPADLLGSVRGSPPDPTALLCRLLV